MFSILLDSLIVFFSEGDLELEGGWEGKKKKIFKRDRS